MPELFEQALMELEKTERTREPFALRYNGDMVAAIYWAEYHEHDPEDLARLLAHAPEAHALVRRMVEDIVRRPSDMSPRAVFDAQWYQAARAYLAAVEGRD